MDIRDLTIFQTAAREKSITKASRLLYMTPQGVSKIIKNLENECECELFIRTANGLILTESGICFLEYAQNMLDAHRHLKNDLMHIRPKKCGTVDLLSAYGILRMVTPECITDFKQKYPQIQFHYREYPNCQVERLFQEHEGNVAFSSMLKWSHQ